MTLIGLPDEIAVFQIYGAGFAFSEDAAPAHAEPRVVHEVPQRHGIRPGHRPAWRGREAEVGPGLGEEAVDRRVVGDAARICEPYRNTDEIAVFQR